MSAIWYLGIAKFFGVGRKVYGACEMWSDVSSLAALVDQLDLAVLGKLLLRLLHGRQVSFILSPYFPVDCHDRLSIFFGVPTGFDDLDDHGHVFLDEFFL